MTEGRLIDPTDLRDFAKSKGWIPVPEAARQRLYVLTHSRQTMRQLVFPMDTTAPDYPEAAALAIEKLADIESLPVQAVWNQIQGIKDDTVRYRVLADSRDDLALPLFFAASMLQGAQQMLLSAAHSVLKLRSHHPRLSRSEAQQVVESALFRHTEKGSFVLKVSCPLQAFDDSVSQLAMQNHEPWIPFVRRTTMTLFQGVQELVGAI